MPARALAAAFAALALLVACAQLPLPARSLAGPVASLPADIAPPSVRTLSAAYADEAARVATVERVQRLVAERFYDPRLRGVDWDAAAARARLQMAEAASDADVYRVLKAMVGALGDSHSTVLTPREVVDRRAFTSQRVGLTLTLIDGQVVVRDVEPGAPAAQAGVRRGDVIRQANGVLLDAAFVQRALADHATAGPDIGAGDAPSVLPPDPQDAARVRVLRAVRRVLRPGDVAQPLQLQVQRESGSPLALTLTPTAAPQPPQVEHRWLDGKVLLIRFNLFQPPVRAGLARALDEAQGARAIVIDLRGNRGGQLALFQWFTGHFLAEPRDAFRMVRRSRPGAAEQEFAPLRVAAREPQLAQPLAVLIDAGSGSAAEMTAVALAEARGALLVGEPSCGCVTGIRTEYVLPDGGGVRVAEDGFVSARGLRLEGEPIVPGLRVAPTLAELRSGRDPVLDAAVRALSRARVPAGSAALLP